MAYQIFVSGVLTFSCSTEEEAYSYLSFMNELQELLNDYECIELKTLAIYN